MVTNFLKQIRKKQDLSIADLARKAGISRYVIWRFEKNGQMPSQKILDKITKALNVSLNAILTGREEPNISESDKQEFYLRAVSMVKDFYDENDFSDKLMIDISTELYMLLARKAEIINEEEIATFKKKLEGHYSLGLASKCLLESMKKK